MKQFFIKLISITVAIILIINVLYNLILAEQLEGLKKLLSVSDNQVRRELKQRMRNEAERSLNKENILNKEDKIILYKLYIKIKKEFEAVELSDK
ncbi:hypothetical protein OAM66_00975 [Pelagibacteraceae bacterium]|jgi:hypothetical protein|nr:hypothetical protein [Pelagibacteraceae bacterium]|tara:strand:- start:1335 stop:1619 length:285 start_codon:yes stop_codon:yes gene_type:complete